MYYANDDDNSASDDDDGDNDDGNNNAIDKYVLSFGNNVNGKFELVSVYKYKSIYRCLR